MACVGQALRGECISKGLVCLFPTSQAQVQVAHCSSTWARLAARSANAPNELNKTNLALAMNIMELQNMQDQRSLTEEN